MLTSDVCLSVLLVHSIVWLWVFDHSGTTAKNTTIYTAFVTNFVSACMYLALAFQCENARQESLPFFTRAAVYVQCIMSAFVYLFLAPEIAFYLLSLPFLVFACVQVIRIAIHYFHE